MGKQKMTEEEMRRKNKGRDKVRWGPFSRLSGHGNCFSIYLRSGYDIVILLSVKVILGTY